MKNFIVLDIKTTGLNPTKHAMLALGAIDYSTGEEFYGECRIDSHREIDPEALVINGFTEAQCRDETKDTSVQLYLKFLEWSQNRSNLLAGQQIGSFDVKFLQDIHEHLPPGQSPFSAAPWPFGHRSIDLHSVAFAKFGKSLKLNEILVECGLEPESDIHNALNGAKLERDCFKILLPKRFKVKKV